MSDNARPALGASFVWVRERIASFGAIHVSGKVWIFVVPRQAKAARAYNSLRAGRSTSFEKVIDNDTD
jgi:hypothetical protein